MARKKRVYTSVPLKENNKKMNFKNKSSYILFSTISCNWNFFFLSNNPEMIPNFQMKPTFDLFIKNLKEKICDIKITSLSPRMERKRFFWKDKKNKN